MRSVRGRTTAAAVAIVGVALLVTAIGLVLAMRFTLTRDVRHAARLRAADVAALIGAGTTPDALAVSDNEDVVIQVVDDRGDVVASSHSIAGHAPVADLEPGGSREVDVPVDDDRYVAVAEGAETAGRPLVVLVARTLETVDESTQVVVWLLAGGVPAILLVVALTTWHVVGRALGPVDAMRREVDEISASELHRRVPDPAGDDEIARLAATMNRMLDRLEEAQGRQHRFVSDASHELRSPVASIRQHAEVALAHPERTTVRDLAETVLAEDLRVQRLVDDLLLLARADEHLLEVRAQAVDLDDLVLDEARRLRDSTSLDVATTGVNAGRVHADGVLLRRVVRNLADNAARHASGRVVFSLAERDGSVVLDVDDDGPGIPVEERSHVFERFVRLDDARARDAGGSGLGLAIVAHVVAAHGGAATAGDSPLGGARLEVVLPTSVQGTLSGAARS